jgi:serine/threonine protein kinase
MERLSGRYLLKHKIGEGGMGTVYVAYDAELDRDVAVKMLAANLVNDAEVMERFEREARLTAKLDHPNIVPIYDVGAVGQSVFIAMEFVEGETLGEWLRGDHGWQRRGGGRQGVHRRAVDEWLERKARR